MALGTAGPGETRNVNVEIHLCSSRFSLEGIRGLSVRGLPAGRGGLIADPHSGGLLSLGWRS